MVTLICLQEIGYKKKVPILSTARYEGIHLFSHAPIRYQNEEKSFEKKILSIHKCVTDTPNAIQTLVLPLLTSYFRYIERELHIVDWMVCLVKSELPVQFCLLNSIVVIAVHEKCILTFKMNTFHYFYGQILFSS